MVVLLCDRATDPAAGDGERTNLWGKRNMIQSKSQKQKRLSPWQLARSFPARNATTHSLYNCINSERAHVLLLQGYSFTVKEDSMTWTTSHYFTFVDS